MSKLSRIVLVFLALFTLASTGFFREFVFVNINEQLKFLWYNNETSEMSEILSILRDMNYWQLYYFKWLLTALFALIFFSETGAISKLFFGHWHLREIGFLYASLFVLSAIFIALFYLLSDVNKGYLIARDLMGMAQSPVPAMIIIPALYLRQSLKRNSR